MVIYNGCLTKNLQEKDRLKFLRFGENDKKKSQPLSYTGLQSQ
jgi:hypothetical protein